MLSLRAASRSRLGTCRQGPGSGGAAVALDVALGTTMMMGVGEPTHAELLRLLLEH